MDTIIKIPSVQNTFSATKNLVDVDIPNNGVWDLTKSYLNFNMSIDTSQADATANTATYNSSVNWNDANGLNISYPNECLIKNAHMTSQTKGSVCDVRRLDTLKATLDAYTRSRNDRIDRYSLNSLEEERQFALSPFRELSCLGDTTVTSRNLNRDIKVNLKDIFDICGGVPAWSGDVFGSTRLHFECNFDQLQAVNTMGQADAMWAVDNGDAQGSSFGAMDDGLAATTGDVTTITTTKTYKNVEHECPFWINQALRISYSIDAGVQAPVIRRITQIARAVDGAGALTGKLLITLSSSVVTLANDQIDSISVTGLDPVMSLNFNSVELVLQTSDDQSPPSSIKYTCYTTEIDNANGLANHSKNYMVEPNAVNLLIAYPNSIISRKPDLQNYRFTINNEQQTNRVIPDKSQLHYDNLTRTFQNMELPLSSLKETVGQFNIQDTANYGTNSAVNLTPIPLPLTENMKIVGVELNAGTGINALHLYKQVQRSI
tara:strand:- start:6401 stop:7870 length:1470 start_codon:yes stop_codon:yes gene_type:complete